MAFNHKQNNMVQLLIKKILLETKMETSTRFIHQKQLKAVNFFKSNNINKNSLIKHMKILHDRLKKELQSLMNIKKDCEINKKIITITTGTIAIKDNGIKTMIHSTLHLKNGCSNNE